VRGELHLLPLAVLRDRGVLDRTLRHELVHLMTDSALGTRPMWVREGAAIYFAGEPPIPGEMPQRPAFKPEPRAGCPDDNELLRIVASAANEIVDALGQPAAKVPVALNQTISRYARTLRVTTRIVHDAIEDAKEALHSDGMRAAFRPVGEADAAQSADAADEPAPTEPEPHPEQSG